MNKIGLLLASSLIVVVFSCGRNTKAEQQLLGKESGLRHPEQGLLGKRLEIQNIGYLTTSNFNAEIDTSFKIIYHFKGDCSTCISDLIEWNKNLKLEALNFSKIRVSYINNSSDNYLIQHYLQVTKSSFISDIILDKDSLFLKANSNLSDNWRFTNVLLIDSENKILAYGNPYKDEGVKKIYTDLLLFK